MFGLNGNFSKELSRSSLRTLNINLSPYFGYFISPNLVAGPTVTFSHRNNDFNHGHTSIGAGVFTRYYLNLFQDKLKIFPTVSAMYLHARAETPIIELNSVQTGNPDVYSTSEDNFALNGGLGLAYFLTPNVAIEGVLEFRNAALLQGEGFIADQNQLTFQLGISVFLNTRRQ